MTYSKDISRSIEDKLKGHEGTETQMAEFWRRVTRKAYESDPEKLQATIETVRGKNPANAEIMQDEYDKLRGLI